MLEFSSSPRPVLQCTTATRPISEGQDYIWAMLCRAYEEEVTCLEIPLFLGLGFRAPHGCLSNMRIPLPQALGFRVQRLGFGVGSPP